MYYDKLYRDTRYEKINRSVMIRTPLDSDIIFCFDFTHTLGNDVINIFWKSVFDNVLKIDFNPFNS